MSSIFAPGECFKSIMQRPEKGQAEWLAMHPRGWVKVAPWLKLDERNFQWG